MQQWLLPLLPPTCAVTIVQLKTGHYIQNTPRNVSNSKLRDAGELSVGLPNLKEKRLDTLSGFQVS